MNAVLNRRKFYFFYKIPTDVKMVISQSMGALAGASQLMRREQGRRSNNGQVKVYKNKRKNLTKAERIQPETTDWPSVFSVAKSFNPATVPLPVRMGRIRPNRLGDIPPASPGNIELLKIPNFLHLTPPAIQRHCEALKVYCTPWPSNLKGKQIRIVTNTYIYAGPSIRHPDSKKVTLKVCLKDLDLDEHAKMKLILLAGPERYCANTDELSIPVDKCPTRKQNKEYALYLLAALYQQCWKTEVWESERPEGKNLRELQHSIADLLRLQTEVKKGDRKMRNQRKIVGGKVIRYNRHGKAFIVENSKHAIYGPPTKEEKVLIEKEWQKIKP